VRGALGDLHDEIPHSGPRIHLECLVPPAHAALAVLIDANPEDPGFEAIEIKARGANPGALLEVEPCAVKPGAGLGTAAIFGEGVAEGESGFGD
jgi:hypothetical protein